MTNGKARRFELVLRATLFMLLVFGATSWHLGVCLRAICGAMLILPNATKSKWGWIAILAIETYANASMWYRIDNHKYLINYWTLACCLSVADEEIDERWLYQTAGKLIGLCFAFAFVWKIAAGEYLNGAFFTYELLCDNRFEDVAVLLGGISASELSENWRAIEFLRWLPANNSVKLQSSSEVEHLALLMSYWTLAIEFATCLLWLVKIPRVWTFVRDICLFVFVVTTYSVVPVLGFASILCILGLAANANEDDVRSELWLATVLAIQFSQAPWLKLLS